MTTRTMARLIAAVGALGVLATVVVSARGFLLVDDTEALVRHAAGGLVAVLLALLAHAWFLLFALAATRVPGSAWARSPGSRERSRRHAVKAAVAAAAAVVGTLVAFATGLLTYAREVDGAWHGGLGLGAAALQIIGLAAGLRGVASIEEDLRAVERLGEGEPAPRRAGAS